MADHLYFPEIQGKICLTFHRKYPFCVGLNSKSYKKNETKSNVGHKDRKEKQKRYKTRGEKDRMKPDGCLSLTAGCHPFPLSLLPFTWWLEELVSTTAAAPIITSNLTSILAPTERAFYSKLLFIRMSL